MFQITPSTIPDFLKVKTKEGLAKVLDMKYKILVYNLHVLDDDKKYKEFRVTKKNGGERIILAPASGIKEFQKRLSKILLEIYQRKPCVYSYVKTYGIKSNANVHIRKNIVINLDLKDFFPSINFGRVQGLFKSYPFNLNDQVSTAIAQICCHKGTLPQGAPTSPIISNYICRKLDNTLMKMSKELRCNYTRYADDLTLSTNLTTLPKEIGTIKDKKLLISSDFRDKIESNGFRINDSKCTYGKKNNRQKVTGIKVNYKLNVDREYIKKIGAMINAWKKHGILNASNEHFIKYKGYETLPSDPETMYEKKIVGMIGYVGYIKGKQDKVYHRLYNKIKTLSPEVKLSIILRQDQLESMPVIFGEGKSDWKHLKAAHNNFMSNGLYHDFFIKYQEYKDYESINNSVLLKMCESLAHSSFLKNKHIFMFDRDDTRFIKKISDTNTGYKKWGNNVYSFVIPRPPHRSFDQVCIEHYYEDAELKTKDDQGRRLFLSDEFEITTGNHLNENLNYKNVNKLKASYPLILDYGVMNSSNENIALPKDKFALNVLNKKNNFTGFSFKHFELIFSIIKEITNL